MSGLSDYTARNLLNYVTGQVAEPSLPAVWVALFTTPPADAGTGATEVSRGSYARVQVAGSAATNGTTASGNATLHFASTPAWIVAGMSVTDLTSGSVIPAATTVLSTTGTTVVMSANATGSGVGSGDTIVFSAFTPASQSDPSPATISNNAIVTFATPTASWGTVVAFSLYDASTGGNLLAWDYLGNYPWVPATVSSASPGVITAPGITGVSNGANVVWSNEYGGTVPSFSQSNFTNSTGLVAANYSAGPPVSFSVTNGGTAVNTSSTGNGMVRTITPQVISTNVVASFAASALTITAA